MKYLLVKWFHEFTEEPVEIFAEIREDGYEERKVEKFRNGNIGYASKNEEKGGTILAEKPYPDFEEIENDPEFKLEIISKDEFERVWNETIK